ncbi:universal stress protein [soil metagenome]|jgi:nucleotide-binding universal stress UspA family protein
MAEFPEKILIATDGANDSELAIERAVDLAETTGCELHVVYVLIMSHWMLPDNLSESQLRRLKEQAQEVLDGQVEKAEEAGGNVTQGYLRTGRRADEEVIDLAEEIEADMIVVGSRGAGTIRRAMMGSDAESIVRHAAIPVLVVRSERDGR